MTATGLLCDHCGLECGGTVYENAGKHFCCIGCRAVYDILHHGDAAVAPAVVIPDGTPAEERLFHLSGLWCSACAWLIERTLQKEPGIAAAEVFFVSDLLKLRFYPQYFNAARIPAVIEKLGYKAAPYTAESNEGERKDLLLRLGVAAFLWLNVMFLNLSVYIGVFQSLPEAIDSLLPFIVMLVALPVILYSAQPVLRIAWRGLRNGAVRMEALLSLGIIAAFGYSAAEAFRGGVHIYFDIACAITTLVLAGKWIEQGAKQRAAETIHLLHRLLPRKARRLNGRFESIEALCSGELFLVKAGERIPADGIVREGVSHADESLLTGESAPVPKLPSSRVIAGSLNQDGVLTVEATTIGRDSTIAQIVAAVERALSSRSDMERKVDRVSRIFVPAIIVFAAAVFLIGGSLISAVTILVIACPCALGIATPLALTAAVTAASRKGILIRDSRVLESVRRIDTVVLDKTGTVTDGEFALLKYNPEHIDLLASLEANSEHPIAKAIVSRAGRLLPACGVEIHKGLGIRGVVGGKQIAIGSARFLGIPESGGPSVTTVHYSIDGQPRGSLSFGARLRPDAKQTVEGLRARGIEVWLVSGDSEEAARHTAGEAGIPNFRAGVLPEEKAAFVAELRARGRSVAMAGDGINDAPALAAADLGIAMSSGADLAMHAASMVLMSSHLARILDAFDLSERTARVVRQNLFWAFAYNSAGIALAAAGALNPIVASAAMVVSSLSVIGNSYRLSRDASR